MGDGRRVLRIIPELRNHHVLHAGAVAGSEAFYFWRKYDLGDQALEGFTQIDLKGALRLALRREYDRLVLWEPLWVRLLPRHVLVVTAWRLGGGLRRRPVVSFAMENNDLGSLMVGSSTVPRGVVRAFGLGLGAYLRFAYGKLAFASEGARSAYHAIPWARGIESTTIPNLPGRRPLRRAAGEPLTAIMVARLEPRKGTSAIKAAWEAVESALPGALLSIVGSGPEAEDIETWVARRPESRRYLGARPHAEVLELVAASTVLVLPSVRDGRWREQIGLPIHEALLNGVTVVTTDETGLAAMLRSSGHQVVPTADLDAELPRAITLALMSPLDRERVIEMLPDTDARISADAWLLEDAR